MLSLYQEIASILSSIIEFFLILTSSLESPPLSLESKPTIPHHQVMGVW